MKLINPSGEKQITVEENQHIHITLEDFSAGSRMFSLRVDLMGNNAVCTVVGRASTENSDEKKWTIEQIISGKNCMSRLDIRGVARDNSLLEFDGKAVLEKQSVDADADISEKIMLTGNARAKSLPVLTVRTDRVKNASHGATVAPVSKETLLYCMSRGLTKTTTEGLLMAGFLRY